MNKFISCVVPGSSYCFFHFGEEIVIAVLRRKQHLVVQNPSFFMTMQGVIGFAPGSGASECGRIMGVETYVRNELAEIGGGL